MSDVANERDEASFSLPATWESERLLARQYVPSDARLLVEVYRANRDRLIDDFPARVSQIVDVKSAETFIHERAQLWKKRNAFFFGVWDKATKSYAGEVCFKDLLWAVPKADIGYFVVRECEGKGIMSASVAMLLPFAFEWLLLEKLQLRCSVQNVASRRVAERCGFLLEGVLRNDVVRGKERTPIDLVYYGMTPEDFRRLQLKPPTREGSN
ncbi:MAG: GNAT family N-acetyltransferase [Ignavibacteriae bacterium]|nr:GNAT family N-acetyltransferase [Ignavibacteriota bacterium]